MTLSLFFIAIMGTVNYFLHRAMLESDNPLVEDALGPMRRTFGRHATYALEFLILLFALMLAGSHPITALLLNGLYTLMDVFAYAFLIHGK